jgi:dihydroxy-acid dehydratase
MAAACASSSRRSLTAPKGVLRIGILTPAASEYPDSVREAGGEPVPLALPETSPKGGVALRREWVADWAQISCAGALDALLISAAEPAELAGLLIAALRRNMPAVIAVLPQDPFTIALAALGFAPLNEEPPEAVVDIARTGKPRSRELIDGFSLANALRAGLALGAGPELLVHLAAIAREAGVLGFAQMIRVLAPESPKIATPDFLPFDAHGTAGLFAILDDALHDTPTVTGRLKGLLPPVPPFPKADGSRLIFLRGRASGTEVLCRTDEADVEVSGECRFYTSEEAAVRAVEGGEIGPSDLLVVGGCGPRGGPGLLRLDRLGGALGEAGLAVPVFTDGLPPEGVPGLWASLATPEAATGGVIGRLRGGDALWLDLTEGLIRTGVKADELSRRGPFVAPNSSGFSYADRYAQTALPALQGAGFG